MSAATSVTVLPAYRFAHAGYALPPHRHSECSEAIQTVSAVQYAVTAVIDWVEKGKAPDSLLASKVTDNKVVRTRPLCPYPQVARYKGQGSIDEAANFSCVAPK